jgi:hypothetical protein
VDITARRFDTPCSICYAEKKRQILSVPLLLGSISAVPPLPWRPCGVSTLCQVVSGGSPL